MEGETSKKKAREINKINTIERRELRSQAQDEMRYDFGLRARRRQR